MMTRTQLLQIRDLARGRLWSAPRIGADLAFWVLAAVWAESVGTGWAAALAIAWIGAGPMHDLLVHGHEGTHRHLARTRWLNELLNWLVHALVWISGTAYRAFHLAHHRWVQTPRDPEYRLLDRAVRGAPGWSYLAIPFIAHVYVNLYPFHTGTSRRHRVLVIRDLVGAVLLHAALAIVLGATRYATYVAAPTFTSLAAMVVLRSVCEHHATVAGDAWTNTRTMNAGRLLDLLWSNASYHLEHHLFPYVPFHKLPHVRTLIAGEMARRGSVVDEGFWRPAIRLLLEPRHFVTGPQPAPSRQPQAFVDTRGLAFRLKRRWFLDLLARPEARRHLWSLYYAGEAYVELHPDAVFIERLEPPLGRLLRRHLEDETRHAIVFRRLLAEDGVVPARLPREEDVGFYLLTEVLPEIRQQLGGTTPFTREQTMRYMAFLHVLELRSLGDLLALVAAARARGEQDLVEALTGIARDERFHASYTHTAVMRLARDRAEARAILDAVRRAEHRHYQTCLRTLLHRFESLGARPRSIGGALRWTAMRGLAALGLAVPLLPLYETLPARLVVE